MSFKFLISVISLISLIFVQIPLYANPASGVFMVVKGDVKLISKGKSIPAKVGQKVFEGDSITTGPDSRAKVVMSDKNVLNISPDTKVEITIYKNDPSSNTKKVDLKVDQGKVRAAVEQKYDDEKNTFRIKTPTAVAGVRGTDFSVSFNPSTRRSQVVTFKGLVAVVKPNANGPQPQPVLVRPGESSEISAEASKPEAPKALPKEELDKSDKESVADVKDARVNNQSANDNKEKSNQGENKTDTPNSKNEEKSADSANQPASSVNKSEEVTNKPDDKANKSDSSAKSEPKVANEPVASKAPAGEAKAPNASSDNKNSATPNPVSANGSSAPPTAEARPNENRAPAQTNSNATNKAPAIPNLVKADDLNADSAKRMTPPPPVIPNLPRVPASAGPNSAVQNVINETVRNQVTGGGSGRTKLKIEIKR